MHFRYLNCALYHCKFLLFFSRTYVVFILTILQYCTVYLTLHCLFGLCCLILVIFITADVYLVRLIEMWFLRSHLYMYRRTVVNHIGTFPFTRLWNHVIGTVVGTCASLYITTRNRAHVRTYARVVTKVQQGATQKCQEIRPTSKSIHYLR